MAWSGASLASLTTSNLAALLQLGTKLYNALTTPAEQVPRADSLTWLPAALGATAPRRRALELPLWGQKRSCVET